MASELRTDILSPSLAETPENIRVVAASQFNTLLEHAFQGPTRSPGRAKDILEVIGLVLKIIADYEARAHTNKEAQIELFYEKPDRDIETEAISASIVGRDPGMYAQGSPGETKTQNRRAQLRQVLDDPDNPGYKRAILGYFYDNVLKLTCWAKTNKQALERAVWLEDVLEEYTWYLTYSGVNRFIYQGWMPQETLNVGNNRYYGRPINYFVRTEKLKNSSQKKLEEIMIQYSITNQ